MGEISLEVLVVLPLIMFCQLACSYLESRFPQLMLHLPEVGVVILIGMFTGWLISTNPDSSLESLDPGRTDPKKYQVRARAVARSICRVNPPTTRRDFCAALMWHFF